MTTVTVKDKKEDLPLLKEEHPLNISAYRLMHAFLMLCQSRHVSFEDMNAYFMNHPEINRSMSRDTMNNYFHTLKLFGCEITRAEQQGHFMYQLKERPLKPVMTENEVITLYRIANLLAKQPITSKYKNFCLLASSFSYSFSASSIKREEARLTSSPGKEQLVVPANIRQLIEQFQKYCTEGQVVEISYETDEQLPIFKLIEPRDVVYRKKRFYLIGNDPMTKKKVQYDIEQIQTHRQLPNLVHSQSRFTTVVFKLTGRMVANYRPYPGETVCDKGEFLLVKSHTDDVEQLLKRLMKYGSQCQVISPSEERQNMRQLIESLISALEES